MSRSLDCSLPVVGMRRSDLRIQIVISDKALGAYPPHSGIRILQAPRRWLLADRLALIKFQCSAFRIYNVVTLPPGTDFMDDSVTSDFGDHL